MATRLSVELALLATVLALVVGLLLGSAPYLLGRRSGRLVSAAVNIAVAFPGILLALFFAVVFGVGATGAVLAIGFAGAPCSPGSPRPWWPASPLATSCPPPGSRGSAGCASCSATSSPTSPSRSSSTPPSAPAARCSPSPGSRSSASACSQPDFDWGRLLFDGIGSIYVNPAAALAPGTAVLLAGLAFSLFGETVAKGFGVPLVGGHPPARAGDERLAADAAETPLEDVAPTPTPTWCSTSATSRSPSPDRTARSARCGA